MTHRVAPALAARASTCLALLVVLLSTGGARADVGDPLELAVEANHERAYTGLVTIASFSSQGPEVTQLEVVAARDGGLRLARSGGWELGRAGEQGYLRRADTLLRIGGTERIPFAPERLRRKYDVQRGDEHLLDTGPATALLVHERATGVLREILYVDAATELVVRRETFDLSGAPVRVLAFTRLDLQETTVAAPDPEGLEVEEHHRSAGHAAAALRDRGFLVAEELPGGFELLGHYEVEGARWPSLHLVYGDGLYTLSLFEQQGRLSLDAVRRAEQLITDAGGAVWRWPGTEPRRVVWAGDGMTFTALTDAPLDETLTAVGGLPTDPPPSTLERLTRGLSRLGRWLVPSGAGVDLRKVSE